MHLSAIGAVLICCVWLWLSSIIRALVTLLRLATAGPLLLFQLLTLSLMGYGLLDVTDCPNQRLSTHVLTLPSTAPGSARILEAASPRFLSVPNGN